MRHPIVPLSLRNCISIEDLRGAARRRLPRLVFSWRVRDGAAMSEGDPIGAAAPQLDASHVETAGPHGEGATTPSPRIGPTRWPSLDLGCGLLVLNFDDPSDRDCPNWAEGVSAILY
jgi:hypothetical protein